MFYKFKNMKMVIIWANQNKTLIFLHYVSLKKMVYVLKCFQTRTITIAISGAELQILANKKTIFWF